MDFACSPHVCVGFRRVLWFPPIIKDMYVRVNTLVSAPDQGVGPWALHCGCPLLLVCVYRIDQMLKMGADVGAEGMWSSGDKN